MPCWIHIISEWPVAVVRLISDKYMLNGKCNYINVYVYVEFAGEGCGGLVGLCNCRMGQRRGLSNFPVHRMNSSAPSVT